MGRLRIRVNANTSFSLGLMLSFRTASTLVSVPIGVETQHYPDCYGGKPYGPPRKGINADDCAPLVEPGDFDIVDDADLSRLSDANGELLRALDTLVDYVFVEKL
ncbi:MAG: hypothetical protein AAF662_03385 [Pseudomonadota bacterium]